VSPTPETRPLFMISVAAELAGMHPQTLRLYERRGLLTPSRTARNTRLYSQADVAILRRIQELSEEGLNLAAARREAEAIRRSLRTGEIVLARRGNAALVRPVPPVCPPQS
jgi:MerR family transcriptional regulator, heat shock protein HspR